MDELVRWLGEQYDEDALWAMEASRRNEQQAPAGGVHWQWEDYETDDVVTPDPGQEEFVNGERFRVSLRSRERWPTSSGVGDLPQFASPMAEEIPSAVGGHIIRHDPARVLREIDAKRDLLRLAERAHDYHETFTSGFASALEQTLRLFALAYADRPGFRKEWAL